MNRMPWVTIVPHRFVHLISVVTIAVIAGRQLHDLLHALGHALWAKRAPVGLGELNNTFLRISIHQTPVQTRQHTLNRMSQFRLENIGNLYELFTRIHFCISFGLKSGTKTNFRKVFNHPDKSPSL